MRNLIYIAGLLGALSVSVALAQSPDIIINTKLDYDFSAVLVKKFKTLCRNFNIADPFSGQIQEPLLLNQSKVGDLLPEESKALIQDFGNAIGLNVIKTETKVWMHGLSYDVKGIKANIKPLDQEIDGLIIGSNFSAEEVRLSAEKISLTLVIPGKNNSPIFNVDILKPVIHATEENLIDFFMSVKLQDLTDHYKLNLINASFDKMAKGLVQSPRAIDLTFEGINIPKVSLKIGNKTVNFSPERIEDIIRENHDAIKGILLAQAADKLQSNTALAAMKIVEQYKIKKDNWLAMPILHGKFSIGKFSTSKAKNNIQLSVPADFCTLESYSKAKEDCIHNKVTKISFSRLTQKAMKESDMVMDDFLDNGNASVVVSVSEDYLNKLLATANDGGLLNKVLDDARVSLGPNKITMRLDQKGNTGTLILDVIYNPTALEKVLIGSKQIRFPLVLDLTMSIENDSEDPVFIVRVADVDTTDETLINGLPEKNVQSTVNEVPRFRNKVSKAIREKISNLRNVNLIELKSPQLKGIDLDKTEFLSDGNGRMNAVLNLDDLFQN